MAAPISGFKDPLLASTQDTTIWNGNFGTLSWTGGGLIISQGANYTSYGGMTSVSSYDLTGGSVSAQMTSAGNQALASIETIPIQVNNIAGTNKLFFLITANTFSAYKTIANVQTFIAGMGYVPSIHKWFRIREYLGNIYFEYGTDGKTWLFLASLANPFAITNVGVSPSMGTYANESTGTSATWVNFNIVPNRMFGTTNTTLSTVGLSSGIASN